MKRIFAVLALLIIAASGSYANDATQNVTDQNRVIARFGIQADTKRQGILIVKKMSQLIKQNPQAVSYGISFSINKDTYKVLDYNRQQRRLMYTTVSGGPSSMWVYHVFPAHIHKAAHEQIDVDALWQAVVANERRRRGR